MQYIKFSRVTGAFALAALLGLGTIAAAQDTTTNEAATEEEATPQPGSDLSLGVDAIGESYIKTENGAWQMQCLRTENPDEDPCQMYQLVRDDQGQPVAEFSLFRLPENAQAQAGATVVVPLETQLTSQLTVQVDGNAAKRYPFTFCNQIGCYARIGLTGEDVALFRAGNNAVLTIVPALSPNQKIRLNLSLTGFTASYNNVSIIEQ